MKELLPGLSATWDLHPLLVHFPIALWCTALLGWLIGVIRRDADLLRYARWSWYLGTIGALAAALAGFWAATRMGHDSPGPDLVHDHRNLMLVATALAAAGAAACRYARCEGRLRWLALALMLATCTAMALGADRGALIYHGPTAATPYLASPSLMSQHPIITSTESVWDPIFVRTLGHQAWLGGAPPGAIHGHRPLGRLQGRCLPWHSGDRPHLGSHSVDLASEVPEGRR